MWCDNCSTCRFRGVLISFRPFCDVRSNTNDPDSTYRLIISDIFLTANCHPRNINTGCYALYKEMSCNTLGNAGDTYFSALIASVINANPTLALTETLALKYAFLCGSGVEWSAFLGFLLTLNQSWMFFKERVTCPSETKIALTQRLRHRVKTY